MRTCEFYVCCTVNNGLVSTTTTAVFYVTDIRFFDVILSDVLYAYAHALVNSQHSLSHTTDRKKKRINSNVDNKLLKFAKEPLISVTLLA